MKKIIELNLRMSIIMVNGIHYKYITEKFLNFLF